MGYLIFIALTLALLGGFLLLTNYEMRRGIRTFPRQRALLDEKVARAEFILEHVDLGAFVREELRRVLHRVGHDIAHLSLLTVRAAERLLTRLVRRLRAYRVEQEAPRESSSAFLRTLSDFKGRLKEAAKNGETDIKGEG